MSIPRDPLNSLHSRIRAHRLLPLLMLAILACSRIPASADSALPSHGAGQPEDGTPSEVLAQVRIAAPGWQDPGQAAGKPGASPITDLPAPLSLSDPDGQELHLEALDVRAAVSGMLSLTELELVFRNPQARRMEGRFSAVLPPNATISRFAKDVNGILMEGEVVERLKANKVYDAILHEMRDPALLEQDQGNRFSARIFPIEAHQTVRLVLSYSQLLPLEQGVRTWALPLRGLPTIQKFSLKGFFSTLPGEATSDLAGGASGLSGVKGARTSQVQVLELAESNYTPSQDLEIHWKPVATGASGQLLRAGDYYLASYRTAPAARSSAGDTLPWRFYVDTSASTADGESFRIQALEAVLRALPSGAAVEVLAFDQEIVSLAKGRADRVVSQAIDGLRQRRALGGTDLEATLRDLVAAAVKQPAQRIVLVSDGAATLGKTDPQALLEAVAGLPTQTGLHALVLGARQDAATLEALTRGRGRVLQVGFTESFLTKATEAAATLARPLGERLELRDPAAEWVFPAEVFDVQPGTEVLTVARLKPGRRPGLSIGRDGAAVFQLDADRPEKTTQPLELGTFAPLLEREGIRSYLAFLADREARESNPAIRQALATEQIRLSVEKRVMIPRTTLLVLETERDYERFGLDRRALASILTVGATGLQVIDRTSSRAQEITTEPLPVRPEPRPVPVSESPAKSAAPESPLGVEGLLGVAREPSGEGEGQAGEGRKEAAWADGGAGEEDKRGVLEEAETAIAGGASMETDELSLSGSGVGGSGSGGGLGRAAAPARQLAISAPASSAAAPPPADLQASPRRRERSDADGGHQTGRIIAGDDEPERKPELPDWVRPLAADAQTVKTLLAQIEANPKARETYNQLSEALWSRGEWQALLDMGLRWQLYDSENPQVYEAIGEGAYRLGQKGMAARAFASLVEIAPGKTELLQRAGLLLVRVDAGVLAEAPLRRALELRPDRPNTYRHLALLLWEQGKLEEAAAVLEAAVRQVFPGWYGDAQRVIREELAYVYRALIQKSPERAAEIRLRTKDFGVDLDRTDDLRISLTWETDANDVDLHVVDPNGEECYYSHKQNSSGLELYEDITQGLGPEVIRGKGLPPGLYHVGVNYFSAGPMGVSRGILAVMLPDPRTGAVDLILLPFRLVEGGRDMRHLASLEIVSTTGTKKKATTR